MTPHLFAFGASTITFAILTALTTMPLRGLFAIAALLAAIFTITAYFKKS